jgi:pseudaminic acid cytidylyltransferase
MKEIRRLAIIPARGNSKRIKKKNIKNFYKKPIIYYSINNAKKSKLFTKIHVSSEDEEILKKVSSYGIKTDFKRPRHLSKDSTKLANVINYVVKEYQKMNFLYDEVWLIYPCAPLTKPEDLLKAAKTFSQSSKKYPLMSFKEFDAPIEWAFKKKNSIFTPVNKKKTLVNSQNLNKNYYESASFVVYAAKHTLKNINFPKYYGLILPKYRAVDIDTNEDWKLAEMFFKKKTNNE